MEKPVKELFNAAKINKEFRQELKDAGEKEYKPSIFWDKKMKIIYACIYMGWLIGKGIYNESDYN